MAIDLRNTYKLMMGVKQLYPLHTFLLDRYFPTNEATDVFTTNYVLVEYKDGNQAAAPFVVKRHGSVPVMREGYEVRQFEPAHIGLRRTLTIDDLERRGFGEALYTEVTPDQRQAAILMNDLDEMRAMIARRKEAMAAETIFTNGCVMKAYADDLGNKYEEQEIRFYSGDTNPAKYTPSQDWDTTEASGKRILDDLAAMAKMLTRRGLPATEALVAPDVADTILRNEYFHKLLDNRRIELGGLDPEELPTGVTKVGRFNVKGHMLDILSYEDTYTEAGSSAVKPFIPAGHVAVTAPNIGRTVYGAIYQIDKDGEGYSRYAGIYVPKYVSDATAEVRSVQLRSAPLCMPNNKNPYIVAKVVSG